MASRSQLDADKAVEVLLYVAARVPNIYHALKVLYFADRLHLQRYGRLIYGDSYVAMDKGPVPSAAYDLVKVARGDGIAAYRSADQNDFISLEALAHSLPDGEAILKYLNDC